MTDVPTQAHLSSPTETPVNPENKGPATPPRKGGGNRLANTLPTLEKLASLYPQLFGAQFLPLKRGIFQDLMAAHPEALEKEALKAALSVHTRSTRYLTTVANGLQRHDLQGQPVEAMAPEHVYQSLVEVFRRRQGREGGDLSAKLRQRIVQAYIDSGLTRDAYRALTQSKDDAANAILEAALSDAADYDAKDEATRRAFEASGQTVEGFADMYGLRPKGVADALARSQRFQAAA